MMRKNNIISLISAIAVIIACFGINFFQSQKESESVKIGFIYVGDAANPYTKNFVSAQTELEELYGDKITCYAKYNICEGYESGYIQELIDEGCKLIIGTSYGYLYSMKDYAKQYPDVVFIQATGSNANDEPVLANYHTFMGHIYEGRYIAGVIGGMKMTEMIQDGLITEEQTVVGYVAAYPYAEVVSGYTAFLLGVRTTCPTATMKVKYANTWSSYMREKKLAEELIDEGCILISQHSDTSGPAVACESAKKSYPVYHVSYNQSMLKVAPTTSLTGCKINWGIYEAAAIDAVLNGKNIEKSLSGKVTVNGNDAGAGFAEGWVEMLDLNDAIAPAGAAEAIQHYIAEFKKGRVHVFAGDYTGVNPVDLSDVINLSTEYYENESSSSPSFYYILNDVIEIE